VGLIGGGFIAYQVVHDDGPSDVATSAQAPTGDQGPQDTIGGDTIGDTGGDPVVGVDGDDFVGVGVEITHDGSVPDAVTDEIGLSQAEVVTATTWADLVELAADCDGRTSTAQGQADADGVLRLDLALFQMVPCEFTTLRLRTGDTWSDGDPAWLDLGTGFDVGPNELLVLQAQVDAAVDRLVGGITSPEDAESFLAQLGDSLASGDPTFAVDRLHPTVLAAFPTQCPAHIQATADPTWNFDVIHVGPPTTYVYAPPSLGGAQYTVPNVITVSAQVTCGGSTSRDDVHVADVDGTFRWFTDCGP
jgi:hypothetical protein